MPWMKLDLNFKSPAGVNYISIPGILYDQNNIVIDTVSDFAAYCDYLGIFIVGSTISWWNPCTQATESYNKVAFPPYWVGTNFAIYPGQAFSVSVASDKVLILKFGQGYKKHLICTETVAKYCEWMGQEEFDSLEG